MEDHADGGAPQAHDYLQFEGGVVGKIAPLLRFGWTGPWPPPERMGVAVGHRSGYPSVFDPDKRPDGVTMEDVEAVADVTVYRRESASPLPDNIDRSHLARGALYRPEEA